MSTRALIRMLMVCAAMLTIELFGYFALTRALLMGRRVGSKIPNASNPIGFCAPASGFKTILKQLHGLPDAE